MVRDSIRPGIVGSTLPRLIGRFSAIILAVMIAGSVSTYFSVENQLHSSQDQLFDSIAKGTAAGLSDIIVARDYTTLQESLRQALANDCLLYTSPSPRD